MNTRKITEAAVFTGMIMALLFIDRQTAGLVEALMFWILPVPTIIYTVKYGYKDGIALALAIIIGSFFVASLPLLVIVVYSTVVGFIYGALVNKDNNTIVTLLIVLAVTIVNNYVSMTIFASFFGYDLHQEIASINEVITYIIPPLSNIINDNIVELIIPTFIVFTSIMETLLMHMVSTTILNRLKIKKISFPNIYAFKISKKTASVFLLFIIMGVIIILGNYMNNLNYLIVIIIFLLCLMFVLLGISNLMMYISTTKLARLNPIITLIMLIIFPYILMIIGIVDSFFNIKSRILRRMYYVREFREDKK